MNHEVVSLHEAEHGPETQLPANVEIIDGMLTEEFTAKRAKWLQDQIEGQYDPQMRHIGKLTDRIDQTRAEGFSAYDNQDQETYKKKIEIASQTKEYMYKTFGATNVREFNRYKEAEYRQQKIGTIEFWGEDSDRIFDEIVGCTEIIDDGIDREFSVPPADRVDPKREDFQEYLGNKIFIDHSTLQNYVESDTSIELGYKEGAGYKIPLANIVSAGGFDSWAGRGVNGRKDGMDDKDYQKSSGEQVIGRSIDAIADYALRETEIPPIEGVDAYVQPNGIVIFSVGNSNHRIAAAVARGQEFIEVDGMVSIHKLGQNLVEAKQDLDSAAVAA